MTCVYIFKFKFIVLIHRCYFNFNLLCIISRNPNEDTLEDDMPSLLTGSANRLSSGNLDKLNSKSKVVEWPSYDALYKKYLVLGKHKYKCQVKCQQH